MTKFILALALATLGIIVGFGGLTMIQPEPSANAKIVVPVAMTTVTCPPGGIVYTVRTCADTGSKWFTPWIPKTLGEFNAACTVAFCGPFPPCNYWALPRSPSPNALDEVSGANQRLYCGTDASHWPAFWTRP